MLIENRYTKEIANFFYWLSKTDSDLVKRCSKRTRMNKSSLGLSVLLTSLLAYISGTFAINTITNNYFLSMIIGILYAVIIMNIDRELVSSNNKTASILRIPLAILIGLVISIPLELKILESRINTELQEQNISINKDGLDRIKNFEDKYQAQKSSLQSEIQKLRSQIIEYGKLMEAEITGRVIKGSTGIAGEGRAYRELENQMVIAKMSLEGAEKDLIELKEGYNEELERMNKIADREKVTISDDFLAQYIALENLKSKIPSAFWIAWGIRLLLMFIEILPALIKIFSEYDEYDAFIKARNEVNIQKIHAFANDTITRLEVDPNYKVKFDTRDLIYEEN